MTLCAGWSNLRSAGPASPSGRGLLPGAAPTPHYDARRRGAKKNCVAAAAGAGAGGSASGSGGRKPRKQHRLFEIVDASPPPRSLGEHPLPPDTHNGDRIECAGGAWVVQRTALHYRLVRGKYVRSAARVDVVSAGRFLVERYLDGLMDLDGASGGGGGGGGRRG